MKKENEKRKEKMQKNFLHDTGMVARKEIKHMRITMRISISYKHLISMTCMFYDAHIYDISCIMDTCIMDIFIMDIYIMDTSAWIARPERPKGVKDEVKEARRAAK